jgi:predicted DNA-binding WGR domain protein
MPLFWIKNNRYYKIIFQPTLFGTIDIICAWGRIGGNLGNYKVVASKDEQDIELIIEDIKKRRKQRGYRLCS